MTVNDRQSFGAPDPAIWRREKAERTEWKKKRDAELGEHRKHAGEDKRVFKTHARIFLAYIRMAHAHNSRTITAAALCKASRVSEAAFHKNFKSGVEGLLLATMEQISTGCRRSIRLQIRQTEAQTGTKATQAERIAIAVFIFVRAMTRYPHLFNHEGVLPREVIYLAGDVLSDAIIWNWNDASITATEKAAANAVAKYHATALIGLIRSGLGENVDQRTFVARVIFTMVSQIVPGVTGECADPQLLLVEKHLRDPLAFRIPDAKGYQHIMEKRFLSPPSAARD